MRSISFLIFIFLGLNSCSAQKNIKRDIIGKNFNYSYSTEHSVLDNTIHFKTDSTLIIAGGRAHYSYSTYPNYKAINDSTYLIYYPNFKATKPTKDLSKDTIAIKVEMADVKNDTIYWKNDKEFIFRERLFKLFEYKGVPLEDQ